MPVDWSGMNIKPLDALTTEQKADLSELLQAERALKAMLADGQTEYANAQQVYNTAMDNCRKENEPALQVAATKFGDLKNKVLQDLTTIELKIRDLRAAESKTVE